MLSIVLLGTIDYAKYPGIFARPSHINALNDKILRAIIVTGINNFV